MPNAADPFGIDWNGSIARSDQLPSQSDRKSILPFQIERLIRERGPKVRSERAQSTKPPVAGNPTAIRIPERPAFKPLRPLVDFGWT